MMCIIGCWLIFSGGLVGIIIPLIKMEMLSIAADYSSEGRIACFVGHCRCLYVLVLEMAPFLYLSYSFTSNNIPSSLIHDGIEVQWSAWPGRYDICSGTVRLRINFRSYAYTFDENIQEV